MNHKKELFIKDYIELCKKHDCAFAVGFDVREDDFWVQLHPNETTIQEFLHTATKGQWDSNG